MNKKMKNYLLTGLVVMTLFLSSGMCYGVSGQSNFHAVTLDQNIKYLAPGIKETKTISVEAGEMQHVDYTCEIDLKQGTNEILLGYREGELTTVSEQIAEAEDRTGKNVVAGVNGNFFNMETAEPIGLLVSDGKVLYQATSGNTFVITKEGEAKIIDLSDVCYDEEGNCTPVKDGQFQFAIAGSSMLLDYDEETGEVDVINSGPQDIKHSRTAVGIRADGSVVLFSMNGKMSPFNYGYTLAELGQILKEKGCIIGMNMDGGGSVTYVSQHPGEKKDIQRNLSSDATERNICAGILVATTASKDGLFTKKEAEALQKSLSYCDQNGHQYISTKKTVSCKTCGEKKSVKTFSGLATEKASGKKQYYVEGNLRKGFVPYDMFQVYYFNQDGLSCDVEEKKRRMPDCKSRGGLEFYCAQAPKGERTFSYIFPKALGHEYRKKNQQLICETCGWKAVDINTCSVEIADGGYTGVRVRPKSTVKTPDGKKLALIGSSLSGDYRRTFTNNVEIGTATVEIHPVVYYVNRMEPRGSIIGSKTLEFQILPYPAKKLKKADAGFDYVKLSWTPSASAGKDYVITYNVYMKKGKTWKKVGNTTETTYQVTGLQKGTEYVFGIRATAVGKDGNTYASEERAEAAVSTKGCKVPSGIKVSNVAKTGKIHLSWKKDKTADKYRVYRSASKDGKFKLIATVKENSYIHTKAVAGKLYYYKISAVKNDDKRWNSALSEPVSRRCDLKRPEVKISADFKTGKPKLSWKKVQGAEYYKVYRATKKNGTYTYLGKTSKKTYVHQNAKQDKTYWYKVKAVDAKYSSAASAFSTAQKGKCEK